MIAIILGSMKQDNNRRPPKRAYKRPWGVGGTLRQLEVLLIFQILQIHLVLGDKKFC